MAGRTPISAEEWHAMVLDGRELLLETARRRRTVTYGEFAAFAGHGRVVARSPRLLRLVGEAAEPLDAEHGIVCASLLVRADTGMPGDGYFAWAADSGRDMTDPRAMWLAEAGRVWDALGPDRESEAR